MTRCTHHIANDPTALCCNRDEHTDNGHTYDGTTVPDRHDVSEAEAERTR